MSSQPFDVNANNAAFLESLDRLSAPGPGGIAPYKSVPQTLIKIPHFVVWKETIKNGKKTKPPFDFRTGKTGDSSDPAVWTDFETAVKAYDRRKTYYDGIGFSIKDTDLVGIDFDGVIDEAGTVEPYVLNIIEQLGNPYAETTPSGTGVRVYVEYAGKLPETERKFSTGGDDHYGAEIYSGHEPNRYFTITGNKVPGSGDGVPKIEDISIPYFLISQIRNAKFKKLWMGDTSHYKSGSEADLALCDELVKLLGKDKDKILRYVRASKLYDAKWDRPDYIESTIGKALTAYGVPPSELQEPLKELKCSSAPVEKLKERAYVLGPNLGEKFGLFRLGQVSLISGSSGGGKTSLINQLLVTQALGADFFEYKTHGYPFVLLSRDRNQDAHEETMERMHLALETIPFVRLPKNVWDIDAAQSIVDAIEKNPRPKVVFVEGIDMLLGEMTIKSTTYFTGLLEDIAQHFQIALICSIGSPKSKKDQGYPAGRDNILGSSGWGRTIDTLWWMQFTKDGDTSPLRHLTIYPRNAGAKAFTLGFEDGQLVVQPDVVEDSGNSENKRAALELTWYQQQDRLAKTDPTKRWWTIVDMEQALNLSHGTAERHAKNAHVKKWIVKKTGDKQGRGAPAQYRWNDSSANPLWVEEPTADTSEVTL